MSQPYQNTTTYSPDTPVNRGPQDDPYMTPGATVYAILSTISTFLMIVLSIIYGRLNYNRVFVYFCVTVVALYIPHVLGAWIYGANLSRAPNVVCWIQGLWINAAGIAAGLTVLLYAFEIYRSILWHVGDDEYRRRKYYISLAVLFPLLVGVVPAAIIADKPSGILPGPYFCFLYKPIIPLAFVSIEGWNTLFSIPGIYFSLRTAIKVAKVVYTRKGFDRSTTIKPTTATTNHSSSLSQDIEAAFTVPYSPTDSASTQQNDMSQVRSPTTRTHNSRNVVSGEFSSSNYDATTTTTTTDRTSKLSTQTIASIPVYVCIRLVLFGLLYCAITVLVYGRDLYLAVRETPYDFKPTYLEYLVASVGIVIWLVFGTTIEAFKAYWRFMRLAASGGWIRKIWAWIRRSNSSFGDWEIKQQKREEEKRAKSEKQAQRRKKRRERRKKEHQRNDSRAKVLEQMADSDQGAATGGETEEEFENEEVVGQAV